MTQQAKDIAIDYILTFVGMATGIASTLDNIEQAIRIVLGLLSIISVVFLIAVNYEKALIQIKKWLKK
jgi:hypothetical protein